MLLFKFAKVYKWSNLLTFEFSECLDVVTSTNNMTGAILVSEHILKKHLQILPTSALGPPGKYIF